MVAVTTSGLRSGAEETTELPSVQWAIASGTADAISAAFPEEVTALYDGLILGFRALLANATTTPVFTADDTIPHTITKDGGMPLYAGNIAEDGEYLIRYDATNSRWELLNPTLTAVEVSALVINTDILRVLAADEAGADANTAQPWFPTTGAATVAADSTYLFEGQLHLSRSAGNTSHTTGVLFGGTATLTSIRYMGEAKEGDTNALADISGFMSEAATELVLKAASTSTTEQVLIRVRGIVRIANAGTFIPQFKYSAAPGGAPTVKANSYFRMTLLGAGNVTSQGTWA